MKPITCIRSDTLHDNANYYNEFDVNVGVWIEGKTYWMQPGSNEMLTGEGISLQLNSKNNYTRGQFFKVNITNHKQNALHAKLLFQHRLAEGRKGHCSFISPSANAVFHLTNNLVYLANSHGYGMEPKTYSVQPYRNVLEDDIWKCSKTGKLKYQPMANGNAASVFVLDFDLEGKGTYVGKSWIIGGKDDTELLNLNEAILKETKAI